MTLPLHISVGARGQKAKCRLSALSKSLYGRPRQPLSLVEYVCIPVVGHACDIEAFSDVILSPN